MSLPEPLPLDALRCQHYAWRGSEPVYCNATWDEPCKDDQGRPRYRHEQHPRRLCCGLCGARADESCLGPSGKPVPRLHAKHPRVVAAQREVDRRAAEERFRGRPRPWAIRMIDLDAGAALAELGLGMSATEADVARVFRERSKGTHPDSPGGSEAAFKHLNTVRERAMRAVGATP